MREILFKAKIKDSNEWVIGYYVYVDYLDKHYILVSEKTHDGFSGMLAMKQYEVDGDAICQCTGLKDKNGKLIWENDIVRFQFDNDDCPFPNKDIKKRIGKVFFSDFRASWSIAMGRNGSKCLNNDLFKYVQNGNRVEIIGNIFDNTELIGE